VVTLALPHAFLSGTSRLQPETLCAGSTALAGRRPPLNHEESCHKNSGRRFSGWPWSPRRTLRSLLSRPRRFQVMMRAATYTAHPRQINISELTVNLSPSASATPGLIRPTAINNSQFGRVAFFRFSMNFTVSGLPQLVRSCTAAAVAAQPAWASQVAPVGAPAREGVAHASMASGYLIADDAVWCGGVARIP
jgi:hypothetical protein